MITLTKTEKHCDISASNHRILIADDDRVSLETLDIMLQSYGYDTLTARNGNDCIALARASSPDLILLDIMMPGLNGFEVCEILRNDPATADIPVMFLSAMTGVKSKVQGFECGAVDYITKPFNRLEVLARTKVHLDLSLNNKAAIAERNEKLKQVHDAQQHLLVDSHSLPEANFAVNYKSYCEAGGDFYDAVKIDDGVFAYLVSDFCGHNLGSSFATPVIKALLREDLEVLRDPEIILNKINSSLRTLFVDGEYITMAYAILDRNTNRFTIASAGHPPVIHLARESKARIVESAGDVLGPFKDIDVNLQVIDLTEGDRFFLFTDGLFERFNLKNFSRTNSMNLLLEYCSTTRELQLSDAVDEISSSMQHRLGKLEDDVVLLGVEL